MKQITQLLEYVQKSNPEMTEDKLIEELSKSRLSASVLLMLYKIDCKKPAG